MKLEDLSKRELLILIREKALFSYSERDLLWVKWRSLARLSEQQMDEGIKVMESAKGDMSPVGRASYKEGSDLFGSGLRTGKRADKLYERIEALRETGGKSCRSRKNR